MSGKGGWQAIVRGMLDRGDAEAACPYPAGSGLALCWRYGVEFRQWVTPAPRRVMTSAEFDALQRCVDDLCAADLQRFLGVATIEARAEGRAA